MKHEILDAVIVGAVFVVVFVVAMLVVNGCILPPPGKTLPSGSYYVVGSSQQ